jgi:signal transduction histidine kinase
MQLQSGTKDIRSWFKLGDIFRELIPGFIAMGADRGITIEFTDSTDGAGLYGVKSHVRIAVSNLLDNAVKYSFSKKSVRVAATKVARDEVLVEIKNYGVGFSKQQRERLFAYGQRVPVRDARRDRHGSGLGLIQAKDFIEECDGSIDIESVQLSDHDPLGHRHLTIVSIIVPIIPEPT